MLVEPRIIEHVIVRRYLDNMLEPPFFVEETIDGVVVSTTEDTPQKVHNHTTDNSDLE